MVAVCNVLKSCLDSAILIKSLTTSAFLKGEKVNRCKNTQLYVLGR